MVTLRTLEEIDAQVASALELLAEDDCDAPCCVASTRPAAAVLRKLRTYLLQQRLDAATEAPRDLGAPLYPLAELEHTPSKKTFESLRREAVRTLGNNVWIHDALRKGHKSR